ncbi:hypothetical protein QVD99_007126 [Batrachochytrium dendrobatidis]|nr:hypothetical protein QVD99_007126 [Batrachochytrium dendrobatidis]
MRLGSKSISGGGKNMMILKIHEKPHSLLSICFLLSRFYRHEYKCKRKLNVKITWKYSNLPLVQYSLILLLVNHLHWLISEMVTNLKVVELPLEVACTITELNRVFMVCSCNG